MRPQPCYWAEVEQQLKHLPLPQAHLPEDQRALFGHEETIPAKADEAPLTSSQDT